MKMFDKTVGKETFMGQTIIEKILSKNLGRAVRAGDEALFEPDLTVAYDYPGYTGFHMNLAALRIPCRIEMIDEKKKFIRMGYAGHTQLIHLLEDVGIGHQVIMEKGYVVPGTMLIHFDGHVSTLGSVGAALSVFATR